MIGGLPTNNELQLRNEQTRSPQRGAAAQQEQPQQREDVGGRRDTIQDPAAFERRVEARRAAEDARLEQFRADELPLQNSRALQAFTAVAGQRNDDDAELAGISIRV
ncbi:MAG: UDP pyrophosphate phosphatase [Marinobacter sp.]|nr:UDP pyrophosphate phosphatase [Marinobacter sp.]